MIYRTNKTNLDLKVFKKIKQIGIELEGQWDTPPECRTTYDSSVMDCQCGGQCGDCEYDTEDCSNYCDWQGEAISKPYFQPVNLFKFLRRNFPVHSDSSCGMHVHVSLKEELDYTHLTSPTFNTYFLKRMDELVNMLEGTDKYRLRDRLDGYNRTCRRTFRPSEQIRQGGKYYPARYSMLNFCYGIHGTVECRVLPMFRNHNNAKLAILEFIDTVETYLEQARKQMTFYTCVSIDNSTNEDILEEETICV